MQWDQSTHTQKYLCAYWLTQADLMPQCAVMWEVLKEGHALVCCGWPQKKNLRLKQNCQVRQRSWTTCYFSVVGHPFLPFVQNQNALSVINLTTEVSSLKHSSTSARIFFSDVALSCTCHSHHVQQALDWDDFVFHVSCLNKEGCCNLFSPTQPQKMVVCWCIVSVSAAKILATRFYKDRKAAAFDVWKVGQDAFWFLLNTWHHSACRAKNVPRDAREPLHGNRPMLRPCQRGTAETFKTSHKTLR